MAIPECTASCIDALCESLSDEDCICPTRTSAGIPWREDLAECISENCKSMDFFTSAGMTYNACGIPNTVEPSNMRPLVYIPFAVQLCFFVLRIGSIWKRQKQPWGLDDITFYLSSALLLVWFPTLILENHFGYSRNLWTLQIWNIDNFTKAFFAFSLVYAVAHVMIKISIVFLYLRIFRTQAVNVAVAIIFIVGLFIVCQPLPFYWAYADDTQGTCHDYIDESGVYPGLNMFLDVWMIVLPASQLWRLKITRKAKIGIMAMICLGLV
ncbi:hypothetical protein INS49_009477 [Diaporthe citri]|uniref:uncharacterized protein n=1 Tax=Diaporthe citri TaxID=83186 RepID=UPI001C826E1D|nr:uncharacterized protein INS49_009477 [Diaporthe citri]KAG6361253.1 hypothetical protein INS49_009477 [Diaporthe citri]